MTREQAFAFLKEIADLKDKYREVSDKTAEEFPGTRLISEPRTIHLWDIREIVDALKDSYALDAIPEESYCTDDYPHKLSFNCLGYQVFAIYTEEDYKEVSAWLKNLKDSE